MSEGSARILLIGYGNPGRLDDGLGPALAAKVAEWNIAGVTVDSDYQLTVEDAAAVAEHDVVIFADADTACDAPFSFYQVQPKADCGFTTHSIEPEGVLGLARDLFGADTRGFILGMRGYEFNEFGEALSEPAQANLKAALRFLKPLLRRGDFDALTAESDPCLAVGHDHKW